MINVYVREHVLPYIFLHSKNTAVASSVGAASTSTSIIFSTSIPSQTVDIWNGGIIVITSGANAGLGANIASSSNSGSNLLSVTLSEEFPVIPETGASFVLIRRNATGYVSYGPTYQLDQYVTSVSVSTDIDKGYATASIRINNRFANIFTTFSAFAGMNIKIFQDGIQIFEGLIADVDYTGYGGHISCIGYKQTFGWFAFERVYDTNSSNTAPVILKDICFSNPYIPNKLLGIDRGDVWHTAQIAIGGIGPRDYLKSLQSCEDALNDILQMGYFGISFSSTYLQIYNNAIPAIKVVSKQPISSDWYIDRNNFIFGDDSFTLKSSVLDAYTEILTTYNNSSGAALNTPSAVNVNFISKLGRRKKTLSVGEGGLSEKSSVVRVANNDFGTLLSAASFKVSGKVSTGKSNIKRPVYAIKAGDVVTISPPAGFDSMYKNTLVDTTTFTVGHTDYDTSTGIISITPIENTLQSEIFAARLKIN